MRGKLYRDGKYPSEMVLAWEGPYLDEEERHRGSRLPLLLLII